MEFEEKTAYILGLVSIVLALSFISPLGGLVSGIAGLMLIKGSKSDFAKKARKLNKVGVIVSAIILVIMVIAIFVAVKNGLMPATTFPTY